MRFKLFAAAAGICLLVGAGAAQGSKQIQIFASVLDGTGAPAKTLEVNDVKLMENGVDAKVTKVEPVNWPVKAQILLDNGVGIGSQNIQQLKNGVTALIDALPESLELTLVTTAPQPRIVVKPTTA